MKRLLIALLSAAMLLATLAGSVSAFAETPRARAEAIYQDVLDYQLEKVGATGVDEWIDGELTSNAGVTSEWFVFTLAQSGEYDFASYETALLAYLDTHRVASLSSRQKYALCLAAIGSTDPYISEVMETTVGEGGVMSFVYGLHLLSNGYQSKKYDTASVVNALLDLQCEDGGWSVSGVSGDADVTAMTVQALAPYAATDKNVGQAIDGALAFLSSRQLESGDFLSYGLKNAESAAQVIVALSALGVDCERDARFIKNGNTLIGVLERYRLSDGSFCHTVGGASNVNATAQAFYAARAYLRMTEGVGALYDLDFADPAALKPYTPESDGGMPPAENPDGTAPEGTPEQGAYKPIVCAILCGVAVLIGAVLFVLKKRHYKNYVAILLILALAVGFVLLTDFQSTEDYYHGGDTYKENVIGEVTVTVRCDTLIGKCDSDTIPDDGVILETVTFAIAEGDTVYQILLEAAQKYGLRIENNGSADLAYIVGIQSLYEMDWGDLSGWVYRVNGEICWTYG